MLKLKLHIVPALLLVLIFFAPAPGQDKDPEAYLRINTVETSPGHFQETTDLARYYFVEIYMPVPLWQTTYDQLSSGRSPKLGVIVQGKKELSYPIEVSPDDCSTDSRGVRQCSRTHFRIYLPRSIDLSKSYKVFFDSYPTDSDNVLRFRDITVGADYSVSLTRQDPDPACSRFITLKIQYEDEEGPFGSPDDIPLKFSTEQDKNIYKEYIRRRVTRLFDWINGLNSSQLGQIEVRVRPLNTIIRPPAAVQATEVAPGHFVRTNGTTWQPAIEDLPRLQVAQFKPNQRTVNLAVNSKLLTACFRTEKGLPNQDFNIRISFKQSDVPLELLLPLAKAGVSGNPAQPTPTELDTGTVGERAIDKDLDIGVAFSSAVEDVEKENPDPSITTPITVRERKTRATLDMRLAPFGTRSSIKILTAPGLGPNPTTTRTSALFRLITPFFIDARVSTGKINKDTLSLNRVVLGTQMEYQYIYRNATYPTYLRFIGRFSNASDRDFKQAEYKGTFEFRPVFSVLNHPLASRQAAQNQVIGAGDTKGTDLTIISFESGGYEFVPFFGGEFGRTYARRNPAPAVEPSETVKRLYLGMDIILNPFKRTTLSLSDTFYFKFDSETKRRANYFKGVLDFRLGKFFGREQAAHSIFLSFERGQQPPFDGAGVNALKLGYRIQADRIFSPSGVR